MTLLAGMLEATAAVGKPGTNWKQIGPREGSKLQPLVRHYMKMAHPFTACVRDNRKRFGEGAERVCAVLKDYGEKRTTWRKGGKKSTEAELVEQWIAEAEARLRVVNETLGPGAAVALAESAVTGDEFRDLLAELCFADLGLLYLCGQTFEFDEAAHPRDLLGRWKEKVGALKPGDSASLPDGTRVRRDKKAFHIERPMTMVRTRDKATGRDETPHRSLGAVSTASRAASEAADHSAQSSHPRSVGGATVYRNAEEAAAGVPALPGSRGRNRAGRERTPDEQQRFNAATRRAQVTAQDRHRRLEADRVRREEEAARKRRKAKAHESVPSLVGSLLDGRA